MKLSSFLAIVLSCHLLVGQSISVELKLLEVRNTEQPIGISWGVPFPKSDISEKDQFLVHSDDKKDIPTQSWPLAYWPDGSIKWMGFASVIPKGASKEFHLSKTLKRKNQSRSLIKESDQEFKLEMGKYSLSIPKKGTEIISSLALNDKVIAMNGRLELKTQSKLDHGANTEYQYFKSEVQNVEIEQEGPIRSVVKIDGVHITGDKSKSLLPFSLRLYCYKDIPQIKVIHTITYNGHESEDFIDALGFIMNVPLDEEMHNRHVRFSGDDHRVWAEPIQPAHGRRSLVPDKQMYKDQIMGKRLPSKETMTEKQQYLLSHWAKWDDYRLTQLSSNGFEIKKRTNEESAWVKSATGHRATGTVFLGDVTGGISITSRDFWQSYPSQIDIEYMTSDTATVSSWLWAPESEAMDMRHYDTLAWGHDLEASYEDVQPGLSSAYGVSRTSEFSIHIYDQVPDYRQLSENSKLACNPALLVCDPEYLHSVPVFGTWSLPDTSHHGKKWIEQNLDNSFAFYSHEIDQRDWYGFWDYGDVMHSYDSYRHQWKYDMGGYAWANTELMPNLWLWYAHIRSGRADIFRMAEAMTRHTSEVDVHHIGKLAGLGSRHNVRHWGGGAKEVRISQSALNRFYYYLTTDERVGDIMRDMTEKSNLAIGELDPLRLILPKVKYPTHARIGPDWLALVGNWVTEWERTGDEAYKERIENGINQLYEMPYGLYSGKGAAMGYDPDHYQLYSLGDSAIGYSHLSILMGGPEVVFEMNDLLQNKKWNKLWLDFTRLWGQPESVIEKEFGRKVKLGDRQQWSARIPAYYYFKTKDKAYGHQAWDNLLSLNTWDKEYLKFELNEYDHPGTLKKLIEISKVSTNSTSQWCLNAIQVLELAGDMIPDEHELWGVKE